MSQLRVRNSGTLFFREQGYNDAMLSEWMAFVVSGLIAVYLTRASIGFSPTIGLVDVPDARKRHNGQVAIAGWALVIASLVGVLSAINFSREWAGLWLGSLIAAATGLMDDGRGLSSKLKALGQLLAALVAVLLSPWSIESIRLFGLEISLGWLAIPFTIFWIMGAINALNLLDGLDGLAAGATAIISATCALMAWQSSNIPAMSFALAICGTTLGFLVYNFCPARVFMGDTGSHFLGYWLAILTVQATQSSLSSPTHVPLLISVLLLGLPVADTGWAILRRMRAHQSISEADRGHIHHRLLLRGWGGTKTVLSLYALVGLLCLMALILFRFNI
ncbi:undecaprenyl/decaprenyl-phosphate alpha-N-acetylglucosaminyl 1-phosphate transferase [Candidatus Acetothermia bacterium]|nr:undecaprenyl/decaprenyl-phosphate alpha-N-acetylglucosaminyl 1-phosphate transferase [Candidatus Acetothermia bacterium]